jgi:hypothetical protein
MTSKIAYSILTLKLMVFKYKEFPRFQLKILRVLNKMREENWGFSSRKIA